MAELKDILRNLGSSGGLGDLGAGLGALLSGGGEEWAKVRELFESLPAADKAELMNTAQAGSSAFGGITEDPAIRGEEADSLRALNEISRGGMRTEDRVAQAEAMNASNANEQGQRGAVLQNLAARGLGGGGTELAATLANQQGSANRAASAGATAASNASQRALQAIAAKGQLAGQMRTQDLQPQVQKAQGMDAMSAFNAGQRIKADQQAWGQQFNKAGAVANTYADEAKRKKQDAAGWGGVEGDVLGTGLSAITGGLF